MTSPIQIQIRTVPDGTLWKRRATYTAFALGGALVVMLYRLTEYAAYLEAAARV